MVFQPGQSGNPKGRPPQDPIIKEWALKDAPTAYKLWVQAMGDTSLEMDTRLKAANNIIERAFGKAPQSVELGGKNNSPFTAMITFGTPSTESE